MNNVSTSQPTADQDGLLFSEAAPAESGASRKAPLKRDLILGHLRSGKSITMNEARQLYGVGHLPSTVSYLARTLGLKIGKTSHRDEFNVAYTSYFLESPPDAPEPDDAAAEAVEEVPSEEPLEAERPDDPPRPDIKISAGSAIFAATTIRCNTTPKFVAELRDMLAPTPHLVPGGTTNVGTVNVRMGTDSIELLLIGEGESENKPYYKLSPEQMRLISASLKAFADIAESR